MTSCKVCNKKVKNLRGLSSHARQTHGLLRRQYYNKYLKSETEGRCLVCGSLTTFRDMGVGYRRFCSDVCAGKYNNNLPEARTRLSKEMTERNIENWKDPEYRKITSEHNQLMVLNAWQNGKYKEARSKISSEITTRLWQDPAYKVKRAEGLNSVCKTPEFRLKVSKSSAKNWEDPDFRKKATDQCIKRLQDPNDNWGKGKRGTRAYYNKVLMRSSWEVEFAKELDKQDVKWEYEKHRFVYTNGQDSHTYIPDFYLPELDLFVEIRPLYWVDQICYLKIRAVRKSGRRIRLITERNWDHFINLLTSKVEV